MAQNQKYGERAGGNTILKKTGSILKSREHTSKISEVDVITKKPMRKDVKITEDVASETQHDGNHLHDVSIIIGKTHKAEWQMTAIEKMNMAREGLSKNDLESLKNKTNLDYDKLSTVLSTNRATLINKKGTAHFSANLSEKMVSIADVYSYGFEVFEDETKFNDWVFRPNQALGGKQPFELLDNQFGREEVKNVIGRIEYGVYS